MCKKQFQQKNGLSDEADNGIILSMAREKIKLPFDYIDTPERRVLSLEDEGFPCIPVLGLSRYRETKAFLDEHRHPECMEISLCTRAPLIFKCEGKTYKLMPGQLFVTQPSDRHHLTTNPKGLFLYWMFFRIPRAGESVLGLPLDESRALVRELRHLPHRLFPADSAMPAFFAELFAIYDSNLPSARRRLAFRSTLLRLLCSIPVSAQREPPLSTDRRLFKIAKGIESNPSERLSVPDMAAKAFMSESVFTARFRRLTGYPPHAYLARCRLEEVKRRLAQTDDSIERIAADLNYNSTQHLAGQFKATFGMTMREWRKSHAQNSSCCGRSCRHRSLPRPKPSPSASSF